MTRVLIFGAGFAGVGTVLSLLALRFWRGHRSEVDGLVPRAEERPARVVEW